MHVYGRVISVMMNGWGGGGGGGGEGSDEAAESPGGGGCNCDVSSLLSYHLICQQVCFPSEKCTTVFSSAAGNPPAAMYKVK